MKSTCFRVFTPLALAALALSACSTASPTLAPVLATSVSSVAPSSSPPSPVNPDVILATTTSTQDSGLLDVLVPLFEQETGYKLKVVAVGTGAALQMGQEGNADVLLVHAPGLEKTYMDGGFGRERFLIMHNDFIVVGPASDPAGIKGNPSAADAFRMIADKQAPFISRGDRSGTNTKELALWKDAGVDVSGKPAWYSESGQGMGATLTIASEKSAYTLTDRATYLANKANLQLALLVEKDNTLLNVYHVITVNPEKWPKINYDGAIAFAKWLTEPSTQDIIGNFGKVEFGQPLFVPDANKTDADLGL
jgi:tungstate transport system substrate-binding protein